MYTCAEQMLTRLINTNNDIVNDELVDLAERILIECPIFFIFRTAKQKNAVKQS